MFNSNLTLKTALTLAIAIVTVSQAQYSDGSGTQEAPYQISTEADWEALVNTESDWDKHFIMIDNLDMVGIDLSPIGRYNKHFTGVLDGNDFIISNVVIEHPTNNFVGLFSYLDRDGQIRNIGIEDANIVGREYVGGLVGYNNESNISNCYMTGSVNGKNYIGGLVGQSKNGIITTCSSECDVTGTGVSIGGLVGSNTNNSVVIACFAIGSVDGKGYVGGLVGNNYYSSINDCYTISSVNGSNISNLFTGGLVGRNQFGFICACSASGSTVGFNRVGGLTGENNQGIIKACSAAGSVSGNAQIGGLVGYNFNGVLTMCSATCIVSKEGYAVSGLSEVGGLVGISYKGEIRDCYAQSSPIYGSNKVGGLVGNNSASLSACYSVGRVDGSLSLVGGLVGQHGMSDRLLLDCFWDVNMSDMEMSAFGLPKTTMEMQTRNTFTNAGWDFLDDTKNGVEETWTIFEGSDYPMLCWEVYYKIAYAPQPSDDVVHPDTWIELSWIPSITAERHDVYFGENFNDVNDGFREVFRGSRTEPNFTVGLPECPYPDGLIPDTKYYWRIDEVNDTDPDSPWKGHVWSFTVVQKKAYDPYPLDGAIDVESNTVLSWIPATDAQSHEVYFGTDADTVTNATKSSPEYKGIKARGEESYDPGTLESAKTYYWRVDEFDGSETYTGNVWSFSIPQWKAHLPFPLDGATEVDPNIVLSWTDGYGMQLHTVYFGDDFDIVNNATNGTTQDSNTYDPGTLSSRKTYFWRVDEFDGLKTNIGDVWSFTVQEWGIHRQFQVTSSEDDGYSFQDGQQHLDWDILKVGNYPSYLLPYHISGMVFKDVNIPQGVRIVSARLRICSHNEYLTANVYGTIQAENTDNATAFDSSSYIGDRPMTEASVDWDHHEPWFADTWYTSPEIADIIQEVIDRGGWTVGSSLTILYNTRMDVGGYRQFSSYDRGNDYAPKLEITYEP